MKALYLDCSMGAAGDMLCAALIDLLPDPDHFVNRFNALGIPQLEMKLSQKEKCGIVGRHVRMLIRGIEEGSSHRVVPKKITEHAHVLHVPFDREHRTKTDVAAIIHALPIEETVMRKALSVYDAIAEAEGKAHGKPVTEIHFHEVGSLDAIADIVAFSMLIDTIAPDCVFASPVHVGSGTVRCAHGVLPVPAPATAELLRRIPSYSGEIRGELCTPTGAALLKSFVGKFQMQPQMAVERVGYGMGNRDFPVANCVRAIYGELS